MRAEFENLVSCLQLIFNARPEGYTATHRSPGFSPTLPDDPTQFLNGQGQFASPSSVIKTQLVPGEPGEEGADGVPGVTSGSGAGPTGPQGPQGPASAPIPGADGDDGQLIVIGAAVPGSAGPPGSQGRWCSLNSTPPLVPPNSTSRPELRAPTIRMCSSSSICSRRRTTRSLCASPPTAERPTTLARTTTPPISPGRRPARAKADHQGKARLRSHR